MSILVYIINFYKRKDEPRSEYDHTLVTIFPHGQIAFYQWFLIY